MNFNDYQREAKTMCLRSSWDECYLYPGLSVEANELLDKHVKTIRDGNHIERDTIVKELGDVIWFVAMIAEFNDIPFQEIAIENLSKLRDRATRGVLSGSGDDR